MKNLLNVLENFSNETPPTSFDPTPDEGAERLRLDIFEKGYKAGWDDAVKAQADDRLRISSELAQNLLDMSFTYHEASASIIASMAPLLQQMVEAVLPELAHRSLGLHIAEQLNSAFADCAEGTAVVAVAQNSFAAVSALVPKETSLNVQIVVDSALTQGQAEIRLPQNETRIDLTGVTREIEESIEGFLHEFNKEWNNGE